MELEELRDELKITSEREYTLVEELLVSVEKKSLLRQLRQVEKHDAPARLEYYGHLKEVARG